jgi:hypothetical protein
MRTISHSPRGKKTGGTILRWVGWGTAVISLILGISQVTGMFRSWRDRRADVVQLLDAARGQRSSGDYAGSWNLIGQALERDPGSSPARAEQADLAMEWLRNMEIAGAGKETGFSNVVDRLLPVLYRAGDAAGGREAADILAHIGWAYYLKVRDGFNGLKVETQFAGAVAKDSDNVYAHAMWGYWILYPDGGDGNVNDAMNHFSAALRSGRERAFVRRLQLAAFDNMNKPEYEVEVIRTVDAMRKNHETLEPSLRQHILGTTYAFYGKDEILDRVSRILAPGDHLETFRYLTEGLTTGDNLDLRLTLAELTEHAGDSRRALDLYMSLRSDRRFRFYIHQDEVNRAIRRLASAGRE